MDQYRILLEVENRTESTSQEKPEAIASLSAPYKLVWHDHPWDAAHLLYQQHRHLDSVEGIKFAEPDILQVNVHRREIEQGEIPQAKCKAQEANKNWPVGDGFAWHLSDTFSELESARQKIGEISTKRVRVGHLDTGYDPNHVSIPEHLNLDLAANFVETDRPDDPIDPAALAEGFLENPGHGTATLGILAGGKVSITYGTGYDDYLGGAPEAEVVPIRIADSVVHFYSSSMARGIEHAVAVGCDVISISMGGVPTRRWVKAVNQAYENGVTICAAAGNNVGGAPVKSLVFPARFKRVIAACGVTADKTAYFKGIGYPGMQGNFGPEKVMRTAIAAYTPNITWAEIGCQDTVSMDGAGTSSATPQVAAAAALWLQKYLPDHTDEPWRRVEAVRHALFSSAENKEKEKFGNGLLRANQALEILPNLELPKTKSDHAWFPWIRVIGGLEAVQEPIEEMYELETLQIFMRSKALQAEFPNADFEQNDDLDKQSQKRLYDLLLNEPTLSKTLREEIAKRQLELK